MLKRQNEFDWAHFVLLFIPLRLAPELQLPGTVQMGPFTKYVWPTQGVHSPRSEIGKVRDSTDPRSAGGSAMFEIPSAPLGDPCAP